LFLPADRALTALPFCPTRRDATRHAFDQYQWLVFPDFDLEGAVQLCFGVQM
jgi:hypothetical protein